MPLGSRPPLRLGIDLGGTKIEVAALGPRGRFLLRRRRDTPRNDYQATVGAVSALVEEAEAELGQRGSVGIGIPGSESPVDGCIRNANSTWLNGRPLRRDLQALLQREVRLANDANCFALSEAIDGAAADAATVFGVILGTGVGGGLVVHRRVLVGANAIAGEWGHNPLPAPSPGDLPPPPCYCGRLGCIETYLSGPALTADHRASTGASLDAAAIAARAATGDPDCEATLARYRERLARALAGIINVFDPEVIVLGGGLSGIASLYEVVPRLWGRHVFSECIRTRLVPPRHGDSSGVRGAAWLWNRP
ncbi:MAG TPA: ROK family protein [Rhodocyclaceae bacterium]|jgi:fructokinase|nr:ROK family protein [Rhodocyclaceae bacterium]HMV21269.1 ROK family protein [Rhodocyclaceae bacterium]HMW76470.1 ROK family protein [Rhodocyclaceae bacterium]HNE43280.1 ROK family protein [Rhodocyclaceae bacterium]HNL21243.1 ROK family protein [Rhodocyclaceae bacterium]